MLELFPDLFILADPGSTGRIPLVLDNYEELLKQMNQLTPEIHQLIENLNQLISEKNKLQKNVKNSAEIQINENLSKQIEESNQRRIKELEEMIKKLQDEFHDKTKTIDTVQPIKRGSALSVSIPKRKKKNLKKLLENSFNLGFESINRILESSLIHSKTLIYSFSMVDINLLIFAHYFYKSKVISYTSTNSTKLIIKKKLAIYKKFLKEKLKNHLKGILSDFNIDPSGGEMGEEETLNDILFTIKSTFSELSSITQKQEDEVLQLIQKYLSSSTKSNKETMLENLLKIMTELLGHNDQFPIHSNSVPNILLTLNTLYTTLLANPESNSVLLMNSWTLWDIHCKPSFKPVVEFIKKISNEYPSRCKLVVLDKIESSEYAGNIFKWITDWSLESHCKFLENNNSTLYFPQSTPNAPAGGKVCDPSFEEIDWTHELLTVSDATDKKSHQLRNFYILYPEKRAPIFPLHFMASSLFITAPFMEDLYHANVLDCNPEFSCTKHWFFMVKQEIQYHLMRKPNQSSTTASGCSFLSLWEVENNLHSSHPHSVSRNRKILEYLIRTNVIQRKLSMEQAIEWLLKNIQQNNYFIELLRDYQGIFIISDHPGKCWIFSSTLYHENIRFYCSSEQDQLIGATSESPYSGSEYVTYRMSVDAPITTLSLSNKDFVIRRVETKNQNASADHPDSFLPRIWKYFVLGNNEFWKFISSTSNDNLNSLRSCIESHLLDDIDSIVADSQSGCIPTDYLHSEISKETEQEYKQSRLISPMDEWFYGQKHQAFSNISEIICSSFTNISLLDAANWDFWVNKFSLTQTPSNFKLFTAPNSIPPHLISDEMFALCNDLNNSSLQH